MIGLLEIFKWPFNRKSMKMTRPPMAPMLHVLATVRGASHRKAGTVNQDAIRFTANSDGACLVLSDGHGAEIHHLSHVGSEIAVEVATLELLNAASRHETAEACEACCVDIVTQIHQRWCERAMAHAAHTTPAESAANHSLVPYGATLLAILIARNWMLYMQIGDGDLVVIETDATTRMPLGNPGPAVGTATESLCMHDAAKRFKWRVETRGDASDPSFFFAASDGFRNSYSDDTGFMGTVTAYCAEIEAHGFEAMARCLPAWLRETTEQGSGDDISVGIIGLGRQNCMVSEEYGEHRP